MVRGGEFIAVSPNSTNLQEKSEPEKNPFTFRAPTRKPTMSSFPEILRIACEANGLGTLYHYTASFTRGYTEKSIFSILTVKHTV